MRAKHLVLFALVAFLCLPATSASTQKPSAKQSKEDPCVNAVTRAEMNQCLSKEYEKAEAEMNEIYRQVVSKLDADSGEKLQAAQSAWIKFRDAHCEFEAFRYVGALQPLIRLSCLEQTTRDRSEQLRATPRQGEK